MTSRERQGGAARAHGERFDTAGGGPRHALDPNSVASAELLRRVVAGLPAVLYRCRLDADRTVEFMGLGARVLTGFEAVDLVANRTTSFARLIHPDDVARVQEVVKAAALSGKPFEATYRILRVDGREAAVREIGYAMRGDSGEVEAIEGLLIALQGPTERELEHLTLDVAHDLNNALSLIKTTAELGQLEARDRGLIQDLSDIIAAANRAGSLVQRLRRGVGTRSDPTRRGE